MLLISCCLNLPRVVKSLVAFEFWLVLTFYFIAPFIFYIPRYYDANKKIISCIFLFSTIAFSYFVGVETFKNEMGSIRRKAILFELEKSLFSFDSSDSGFEYHSIPERNFSLNLPDYAENLRKRNDVVDKKKFEIAIKRAKAVNTDRYLLDIVNKLNKDVKSEEKKIINIVEFVQKAMYHDPFGQSLSAHPVIALEYGRAHCTITNQYVLRSLLEASGFETKPINLKHHSVLEVFYEDDWHYVDADMFEQVILNEKGKIPRSKWIKNPQNYYTIDKYAR